MRDSNSRRAHRALPNRHATTPTFPPVKRIPGGKQTRKQPSYARPFTPRNARLDAIITDRRNEQGDVGPPNFVSGPLGGKYNALYKIKIQGGPSGANSRLLVCRGPDNPRTEITLLYGAREIDRKWQPVDARDHALKRLQALWADPRRRIPHEWVPERREH